MSSYTDTHYFKNGKWMCDRPRHPRGGAASSIDIVGCPVCLRIMFKEIKDEIIEILDLHEGNHKIHSDSLDLTDPEKMEKHRPCESGARAALSSQIRKVLS